jgi:hypothetical protein
MMAFFSHEFTEFHTDAHSCTEPVIVNKQILKRIIRGRLRKEKDQIYSFLKASGSPRGDSTQPGLLRLVCAWLKAGVID